MSDELTTPEDRITQRESATVKALTSCNERQAATIVNLQAKVDEQSQLADRAWEEVARLRAENEGLRIAMREHYRRWEEAADDAERAEAQLAAAQKEAVEAARRSALDQAQCDEMTATAGRLAEELAAAIAAAETEESGEEKK